MIHRYLGVIDAPVKKINEFFVNFFDGQKRLISLKGVIFMAENEKNKQSKINENIENNNNAKQRWRKWHITLFDSELSKDDFFKILSNKQCHYAIIGCELAPTTGSRHMHAYVEYDNACTFNSLKKLLADYNPNIQKANGTASQNKVYITKEDKEAIEYGTPTSIKYCGDDIASNIIIYLEDNPNTPLTRIAVDVPEFSDYIVKNYRNLTDIQKDLKELFVGSKNGSTNDLYN